MKEISIGLWFGMVPVSLVHVALGELVTASWFAGLFVVGAFLWCGVLWWESFATMRRAARRLKKKEGFR